MPAGSTAWTVRFRLVICATLATMVVSACARPSSAPVDASALRDSVGGDSPGKLPGPGPDRSNTWGGEHLELVVSDSNAILQYDCAHGTMSAPPKPDASGRFVVAGTHVFEHGGPVRADEPPERHAATYNGRIVGTTMTLNVEVSGVSATIGPFTLRRRDAGRLYRCY